MEDKYVSKFVIASICTMVAILMFIITDSAYMFNALAQTNETDIGTNRIVNIPRTTSSGENVTDDDDDDDVVNTPAQTNETDIGTNRIVNIPRTTSSGENVTDDDDDDVGNALIMPSIIINNVCGVATDNFTNIFIADSGNHTILKFDGAGKFITKWGSTEPFI
jgi:hypothetical protein